MDFMETEVRQVAGRYSIQVALRFAPSLDQRMFNLQLIKNSGNKEIDQTVDRRIAMIPGGHGGQYRGAGQFGRTHVFNRG